MNFPPAWPTRQDLLGWIALFGGMGGRFGVYLAHRAEPLEEGTTTSTSATWHAFDDHPCTGQLATWIVCACTWENIS